MEIPFCTVLLTEGVQKPPKAFRRHRDMERRSGVVNRHAPPEAGTSVQGDGAHMIFINMLVHLKEIGFVVESGAQGLSQGRQSIAGNDHYRSMDLGNFTDRYLFFHIVR